MRETDEIKYIKRHSKEENILKFLEQNKNEKPPIKICKAENIVDVKQFCEVQIRIIQTALSQVEYDHAVMRTVQFRAAIKK